MFVLLLLFQPIRVIQIISGSGPDQSQFQIGGEKSYFSEISSNLDLPSHLRGEKGGNGSFFLP